MQRLVEAGFALILLIVLAIYMLIYGDRIGAVVRGIVPPGDGTPDDDFPTRMQASLFGYVRGQVLFSLIMGTSAGLMLCVLGSLGIFPEGKTYAIAFGAWFGFAELIPYVGPAIGGFPPVLIAALSDNPIDAVWLIIAFTVLQQLEGHVVAPNVFGQALRINPLLVIFALLMGGQIAGFIGAFIALPIAAILRETIVYLRRHLAFQRWDLPAAPPPPKPQTHCPECGVLRRRAARRSARRAGPSSATATPRPPRPPPRPDDGAEGASASASATGTGRRCAASPSARRAGERLAVIGPNGAGKTTLLQILAGALERRRRRARRVPAAGWVPQRRGGLLEADGAREPAALRAAGEGAARARWRGCSS